MQIYADASNGGAGGGLVGGALAMALMFFVGRAGAYLVFLVILILCMVCITGKSFVSAVKQGSGRAYQYAREDMDRRKEIHAQRAEERKLLREEQRVRGVNLNATRLTAVDEGRRLFRKMQNTMRKPLSGSLVQSSRLLNLRWMRSRRKNRQLQERTG